MDGTTVFLLILLVIVLIGCVIRSISHCEDEAKFDVSAKNLIITEIEGDHYLIYFDASKFPSTSSSPNGNNYTYYPTVVINKTGRVENGECIATVKIMRKEWGATPSTGSYEHVHAFKSYNIQSFYDGVVSPRYVWSSQMTKFLICEIKPGKKTDEDKAANEAILKKYGITEQYYSDLISICEKIKQFSKSIALNLPALDAISKVCNWKDDKKEERISHLIVTDALRCFEGSNTTVALDSKEGLGFMVLIWGLICDEYFPEYKNLNQYYQIASNIADYIQTVKTFANETFKLDRLAFPGILSSCDSNIRDNYLTLLHKWASIVANADNKVSEQELEWLDKLASYQDIECQEGIILHVESQFLEAAKHVVSTQKASTSDIQRKFSIGYSIASRIMNQLEEAGIVGPYEGSKPRTVNITTEKELDELLFGIQLVYGKNASSVSENTITNVSSRDWKVNTIKQAPMKELDNMIGLTSVKEEIKTLYNFVKIQKMREDSGMKTSSVSYHCVFTGNPGTGKTTVARIVARIYRELGVLSKGHLVETDRSGLVAEYVGQTAVKTNKIIDSALDGVLFIDEAYSLSEGGQGDFGREAIATLLKRMEDDRKRLVVILAGYSNNMKDFINTNPGLQSRFNRYIDFPDYSSEELYQIFVSNVKNNEYSLSPDAEIRIKEVLDKAIEGKDINFGNGRFVRNIFEKTIQQQANRISIQGNITTVDLGQIKAEDILL